MFRKKDPLYFSSIFTVKVLPIFVFFLAEIFFDYPLIQHSGCPPLLNYVNTLPCEMKQCKIMAEQCSS